MVRIRSLKCYFKKEFKENTQSNWLAGTPYINVNHAVLISVVSYKNKKNKQNSDPWMISKISNNIRLRDT
jgi:hypothetical protein